MRPRLVLLTCAVVASLAACGGDRDRGSRPDASPTRDSGAATDGGGADGGGGVDAALPDAGPLPVCACAAPGSGTVWSRRFAGPEGQQGLGIAVGDDDGLYLVGRNTGTTDLGAGALTTDGEAQGIFLAHFDCTGTLRWNRHFVYPEGDGGIDGIERDADGNLVLSGYAVGDVDFGGGVVAPAQGGNREIVVVKLGPDGGFRWAWRPGWGNAHDVAFTPEGHVVVAGQFSSTVDFGAGPVRSMAQNNAFVAALDGATGTPRWAHPFAGDAITRASAVDRLSSGAFLVGGSGALALGASTLDGDGWVLEVAADGTLGASRALDPTGGLDGVWDLTATSDGGATLIGRVRGTSAIDAVTLAAMGETDLFVLKLDASHTARWGHAFGAPTSRNFPIEVREGPDGDVALVGSYEAPLSFESMSLPAVGETDVMVVRLDAGGGLRSIVTFGGTLDESGLALAVDGCGQVLVTGHTRSHPIDLGTGPLTGTDDGQVDMFLGKLAPP